MRIALNGLYKRRTSSAVLESTEYSVNTTSVLSCEAAVCALAGNASIAAKPAPSRSNQRVNLLQASSTTCSGETPRVGRTRGVPGQGCQNFAANRRYQNAPLK